MKSAVIPEIRVEPALLAELKAGLRDGETLAGFVEAAVRRAVEYRRVETEFHARGDASWADCQRTGEAHSVTDVLARLRQMTAASRARFKP